MQAFEWPQYEHYSKMPLDLELKMSHICVCTNGHYFIYEEHFWPRDPYFEWFGYWLKDEPAALLDEPPIYYSPRSWTGTPISYKADDWRQADQWPPAAAAPRRFNLTYEGGVSEAESGVGARGFTYDPRHPVPTYGGRNMAIDPGPLDQRPASSHRNYGLLYEGEPLDEDLFSPAPYMLH